ncbi:unnamed protein product [Didymodactylos carnosus]|uniref:FAD-binding domain-containing protein n=1 Tax=Didymodactylos carnosus TaxID=1234261 RepID=A0A8S2HRE1_9BILA|nr:unnamed protein product [Didymodactylos carnosus]CAF3678382.1 unnamed protein product [Didymodactylos carnosus]
MNTNVDVVIAGGGIGGLVTALCLHKAGFSVQIYEASLTLKSLGVGISIQPHGIKFLYELGLAEDLDKLGIRARATQYYSRNGQFIYEELRGLEAGYNWPEYLVHRGDLQLLLCKHVLEKVGKSSVVLGHKLIGFESFAEHVEVKFLDRSSNEIVKKSAKLLIGADGISSTVRTILYPDEGPPVWSGVAMWCGVQRVDKLFLDGRTTLLMGNLNRRLVVYPINENSICWFCHVRIDGPGVKLHKTADWNTIGRVEDVLPLFEEMKTDFLDISNMIRTTEKVWEFPVTDRNPLPKWTHNRVTLLGDAAHAMYPIGGNGAAQAILDAQALVQCFQRYGPTVEALEEYDNIRRGIATSIVNSNRQGGPQQVLKIVDEHSPNGFKDIRDIISKEEVDAIIRKYNRLAGFDLNTLNNEPNVFPNDENKKEYTRDDKQKES